MKLERKITAYEYIPPAGVCCENMSDAMRDQAVTFSVTNGLMMGSSIISFCPFCGTQIEVFTQEGKDE